MNRIEELEVLIYGTLEIIQKECKHFALSQNEKCIKSVYDKILSLKEYTTEYNKLITKTKLN
jgi:hypothetical protein